MRPLIAGNWKMNGLAPQLGEIEAIAASVKAAPPFADILICPPATLIARAAQTAAGRIAIGGQDCQHGNRWRVHGRHQCGNAQRCRRLRGHRRAFGPPSTSWRDRRHRGGESESRMARGASGDHLRRRDEIAAAATARRCPSAAIKSQAAFPKASPRPPSAIGYEPLWAIGAGHMPTSEEIVEMHAHIRQCLWRARVRKGKRCAFFMAGRSNRPTRATILALPEVGGALVGGASLKAADFEGIFRAVSAKA